MGRVVLLRMGGRGRMRIWGGDEGRKGGRGCLLFMLSDVL